MRNNNLDRELSLILLMTENRAYTVSQMCERLGISARTLYYYIEFFRDYGFIVEKHGRCYSLDKDSPFFSKLFKSVRFTEDEAIAMRRLLDRADDNSIMLRSLRGKLDKLYDLDILSDTALRERDAQNISTLYQAIKMKKMVAIHRYSSPHSNSVTGRVVEPFHFLNGNNEVRCYEVSSGMNKTFKISRMESVEILDDDWRHESRHRQLYTDIFMFSAEQTVTVELRLGRLSCNLMLEEYPDAAAGITPCSDGLHWELRLDVCSYAGIGRFVLGLSDDIRVLGDAGFIDYLRDKAAGMSRLWTPAEDR